MQQNVSRELWGRGAFGGLPAAVAYVGGLAADEQGTEFNTDVPHARNGHPAWAYWYLPEDGGDVRVRHKMEGEDSFACVPIDPVRNRYRCRHGK